MSAAGKFLKDGFARFWDGEQAHKERCGRPEGTKAARL